MGGRDVGLGVRLEMLNKGGGGGRDVGLGVRFEMPNKGGGGGREFGIGLKCLGVRGLGEGEKLL